MIVQCLCLYCVGWNWGWKFWETDLITLFLSVVKILVKLETGIKSHKDYLKKVRRIMKNKDELAQEHFIISGSITLPAWRHPEILKN